MTNPIKDGTYAYVSGTVGRINDGRFTIEVLTGNNKYPDYVTVWRPEFPVQQGDRITVKGKLSWKKTERNDKVYVDVSVNFPEIVAQEHASVAVAAGADPWGASNDYGTETPF